MAAHRRAGRGRPPCDTTAEGEREEQRARDRETERGPMDGEVGSMDGASKAGDDGGEPATTKGHMSQGFES